MTEVPSISLRNSTPPTDKLSALVRLFFLGWLAVLSSGCLLPTGPGNRQFTSKEHVLITQTDPGAGLRFTEKFLILDDQPGELLWLTSASLRALPEQGADLLHKGELNLLRPHRHLMLHGLSQPIIGALFRFSFGVDEVSLPSGFGLPVNSNEPCNLVTESQASAQAVLPKTVQFKSSLNYLRDRGRTVPMRPLYCAYATSFVAHDTTPRYFDIQSPDPAVHGSGTSGHRPARPEAFQDSLGQYFVPYWFVPPGQQETRTLVSKLLLLQADTKLHHATPHLLPFGVSVELFDLTTQKSVVKLGWAEPGVLEQFSSTEGIPMYKDHQYELVAVYHNTSESMSTGAASLTLYLADQEFGVENP